MEKDQENQPDSMMEYDQDSPGAEKVAPLDVFTDKPLQGKNKFPNMKKSTEEEDMKDGSKVKDHCCVECKKRFSSGKALGGHISMAHVQANRDFSLTRRKSKKKRLKKFMGSSSPSDYGGKNICKICWKDFPTDRSLFGHMKCHPNRAWRGMEPPAEDAMNFSEPEFEAMNRVPPHVLDGDQIDSGPVVASSAAGLNESVKWQVTGQRGRAPTKTVIDSLPLPSSEEILAVQQLVRLLDGDSRKPSEDLDSTSNYSWISEDETDDVNQDFQLNKNKEKVFPVGDERDSPVKKLKIWERADETPGGAQVGRILYNVKGKGKLDHGFDNEFSTNCSTMIKEKTGEEKKSVRPELQPNFSHIVPAAKSVPPAATADKYIFSTYRESFSTPIGLGGQRSSHKEIKVGYNPSDDQSSNEASYAKDEPKINAIKQLEVNKALGIQNQCHCTGECNHPDHITSTEEAKSSQDGKDGKESGNAAS
ncbi:zinc finger ZAT9-like [Olea europaea subsp. europaea]|uniref:Zinc finger ZAT9-like n=1 Tax=Olea europaea subsp. europaea TaxID=158383 RepID=A0A8S0QP54_OLEEU|nr:zinc finger ZAT9-like [Olea europaea subsp. europaea]